VHSGSVTTHTNPDKTVIKIIIKLGHTVFLHFRKDEQAKFNRILKEVLQQ
jgi:hypothetical protein